MIRLCCTQRLSELLPNFIRIYHTISRIGNPNTRYCMSYKLVFSV
jgi:hypothetical protein